MQPREIDSYQTTEGKCPFEEWLDRLKDKTASVKIKARLARVSLGNLGNYQSVGEGVCELKIDYGAGYRVYFGQVGMTIIILLCGGDKSTQDRDIRTAKKYWKDYARRKGTGN
jgi:putative addiction module killer protein